MHNGLRWSLGLTVKIRILIGILIRYKFFCLTVFLIPISHIRNCQIY